MKFTLYTLLPEQKLIGSGTLCVGEKEKDAQFFEGDAGHSDRVLAELERVQIAWAAKAGIKLTGMQPARLDKKLGKQYAYQEWFLSYLAEG
jgi:hypothetical protein